MTLVSRRRFARENNVSEGTVRRWLKSGRIVAAPGGMINLEAQRVNVEQRRDLSKVRHTSSPVSVDGRIVAETFQKAKAAKETFKARREELEYKIRSGELIEKSVVRTTAFRFCRTVRDAILNLPLRVCAEQAAAVSAYLRDILADVLGAEKADEVIAQIGEWEIERITLESWNRESRSILENLDDGRDGQFIDS